MTKFTSVAVFLFGLLFLSASTLTQAQNVGINTTGTTPNPAAILDLSTGNTAGNMGFLAPQASLTSASTWTPMTGTATVGMIVYNTYGSIAGGSGAGYYYWGTNNKWNFFGSGSGSGGSYVKDSAWLLTGNSITAGQFIGTNSENSLVFKVDGTIAGKIEDDVSGQWNTSLGWEALLNNTGSQNTAMGRQVLQNASGIMNTAMGAASMFTMTSGQENTGFGVSTMGLNSTGNNNTAVGWYALNNTTASNNTGVGSQALLTNTTGSNNTAIGFNADVSSGGLTNATAIGYSAKAGASNTLVLGNGSALVGINTSTPQRLLEIGGTTGTTNTIRVDGFATGGNFLTTPASTSNLVISNNASGDLSALVNGAAGTFLTMSSGVPTWSAFSGWLTTGNTGTTYGTNYLGTNDDQGLMFKVDGSIAGRVEDGTSGLFNTALGYQALNVNTGSNNVANGFQALYSNTTGGTNVATGSLALYSNTTGGSNTATGAQALYSSTTGTANTATGVQALYSLVTGSFNTAEGWGALKSISSTSYNAAFGYNALNAYVHASGAGDNTAIGALAMTFDTSGNNNTAVGYGSMDHNLSGSNNTATGSGALAGQTVFLGYTGANNTANGSKALFYNSTGSSNTGIGYRALFFTNASFNTALGDSSLTANTTGSNNTAVGYNALVTNTSGSNNTALGYNANVSSGGLSNVTVIGNGATATVSNSMILGNANVTYTGLNGAAYNAALTPLSALTVGSTNSNGDGAYLPITGGPWMNTSDSTQKRHIKNIKYGLAEVMKLRPVNFDWKVNNKHDIGFIAQEVKLVLPELVDGEEGHMHLAYSQITAVLAKAIQEQQQMIDSLKTINAKQAVLNTNQQSAIDDLEQANKTMQAKVDKIEEDMATLKKMFYSASQQQASVK